MSGVVPQAMPEREGPPSLTPGSPRKDRSIGAILIDAGRISIADAERVLQAQRHQGLRFGETAIKLGLITQEDVRFALSRQFDFPYVRRDEANLSDELVAAFRPFSKQVESIRALRSQLLLRYLSDEPDRRSIALVSAGRREGRTRLAANLAVVFSQLGERTVLLDCDLRYPRIHEMFNLNNGHGLSTVLSNRGDPVLYRVPSLLSLSVLTSGPVPPNPQELLSRPAFGQLLERLREKHDVIIVDTPAADQSADAYMIAARAGAAIILARQHKTRYPTLRKLGEKLESVRVALIGSVMNEF